MMDDGKCLACLLSKPHQLRMSVYKDFVRRYYRNNTIQPPNRLQPVDRGPFPIVNPPGVSYIWVNGITSQQHEFQSLLVKSVVSAHAHMIYLYTVHLRTIQKYIEYNKNRTDLTLHLLPFDWFGLDLDAATKRKGKQLKVCLKAWGTFVKQLTSTAAM